MTNLTKTTQAIVKWNNMTAIERLSVMNKTGLSSKNMKKMFSACITLVASEL